MRIYGKRFLVVTYKTNLLGTPVWSLILSYFDLFQAFNSFNLHEFLPVVQLCSIFQSLQSVVFFLTDFV